MSRFRRPWLRLWLVLALALAAPAAAAQAPPPPDPAVQARPLLWELADADSRVWLFGSVHVLRPGDDPLPGAAAAAYARAGRVVFEIHPDSLAAASPMTVLERGMAAPGKRLSLRLGPADAARLDVALAAAGLPSGGLDAFEPWVAMLALGQGSAQRAGLSGAAGVEMRLAERMAAEATPREVGALETIEDQLGVFADRPVEAQLTSLRLALRDTTEADAEALVAAWRAGDEAGLARAIGQSAERDAPLFARLFTDRNARWVPEIEALLDATDADGRPVDVLVIVGAGHLVGPGSVVEMLRARGREVVRVGEW